MFIGHFGVGLALKRAAPRTSLGVLTAAAQTLDLLWPWFLLLGWESVRIDPGNTAFTPLAFDRYPWSHSLLTAVLWGAAFAIVYGWRTRLWAASLWIAGGVVSHWILDWITHRPDLPLTPWSSAKFGLGLWNSVPATLVVEIAMFAGGIWLYVRTPAARGGSRRIRFWLYVATLALLYAANLVGPPPPNTRILAISALAMWLLPLWAWWVDRATP